jgi:hypothetical protein
VDVDTGVDVGTGVLVTVPAGVGVTKLKRLGAAFGLADGLQLHPAARISALKIKTIVFFMDSNSLELSKVYLTSRPKARKGQKKPKYQLIEVCILLPLPRGERAGARVDFQVQTAPLTLPHLPKRLS